jgi:cysteine synthase A
VAVYDSILETIGRTPVVRINRLAPEGVSLYAKVEAFNPLGSVKDRLGLGIIEDAERRGLLKPGQTVVEATSGNTGIGLAMVCAAKGYPLVIVMPENFSVERRKIMRFLGAKVVLTPATQRGVGTLIKAQELVDAHGWFYCRQFENEANADIHSKTTAREILEDFEGERLDWWVTGYGTGGTLKGVARVLREERPETKIAVCEPDNSAVLSSGVKQPRRADGSPDGSHPVFRPHLMQGWSPDFIPKLTEDVVAAGLFDRILPINGDNALRCAAELSRQEGIFAGISAGATLAGALRLCQEAPKGSTILCMLPDTAERYLSTPLFEGIREEMTEEEEEISRSTPSCRFDVCQLSPQALPTEEEITEEATSFVSAALSDREQPVVMFALEWCEFCWSVRKLFARCGIPYRSVDLDAAALQEGGKGAAIRAALMKHTSFRTIPQIFVAGRFFGGCTESLDAWNDGSLKAALKEAGVAFDGSFTGNAYEFLPSWLHPR